MLMHSRFDITVAKDLPVQQVAHPKATTSNAQQPACFQLFLLEHREDSRPNYSLLVMKREEDPGGKNLESKNDGWSISVQ